MTQVDELLLAAEGPLDETDESILDTFGAALAESKADVHLGADWG